VDSVISKELVNSMKVYENLKFQDSMHNDSELDIAMITGRTVYETVTLVYNDFMTYMTGQNRSAHNFKVGLVMTTVEIW
jgi:hypothetical protein